MTEISIHIKLFGAFRKFGGALDFCVPAGSTVATIKKVMSGLIKGPESTLVFDSVLADDDVILQDNHIFETNVKLCILPPVCGG